VELERVFFAVVVVACAILGAVHLCAAALRGGG